MVASASIGSHDMDTTLTRNDDLGLGGRESRRELDGLVDRIRGAEPGAREEFAELFSRGISLLLARDLGPDQVEGNVERILAAAANDIRQDVSIISDTLASAVRSRLKREVSALRESRAASTEAARAVSGEAGAAVRKVLGELSSRQKEILRRHYILEQPRQQICAEMHISEPEFRSLKNDARNLYDSALRPKPVERYQAPLALRQSAG